MNLVVGSHYWLHIYYSVLFVRSITTIITITLKKKTQISRFQFKKFNFLFFRRFRDISVQEVVHVKQKFLTKNFHARYLIVSALP